MNNQQVSTDLSANDGEWHHIVFTWSSNRGGWKMYKDGVTFDTGYGLAPGQVIKGLLSTNSSPPLSDPKLAITLFMINISEI